MVNISWLSSTICTWCRPWSEQLPCTTFCEKSCGNMPRSACTTERRASGIVVVLSQTGATFSKKQQGPWTPAPEFGVAVTRTDPRTRESPSWAPPGRQEFVERELAKIIADHSELLTRIPDVQDLQCAWLLLLCCRAARANFYIRTIRPELPANFARSHDDQIWQCFCNLLRIRPDAVAASAKAATSLSLVAGDWGLVKLGRFLENGVGTPS